MVCGFSLPGQHPRPLQAALLLTCLLMRPAPATSSLAAPPWHRRVEADDPLHRLISGHYLAQYHYRYPCHTCMTPPAWTSSMVLRQPCSC